MWGVVGPVKEEKPSVVSVLVLHRQVRAKNLSSFLPLNCILFSSTDVLVSIRITAFFFKPDANRCIPATMWVSF